MIKLKKKAIELLDAVTSVPYSRKGLGYTIGHGLDAVLPFTCYSDWFSCYFDQRRKSMKALQQWLTWFSFEFRSLVQTQDEIKYGMMADFILYQVRITCVESS
jgi:hypothetical protein